MKFSKGFTLAEVLITLAIVGVLAALTVPTLMNNVAKQHAAAGVMRAFNTLQNANRLLLSQANTTKISAACVDKNDYLECLAPHVNYVKADLGGKVYYEDYLGATTSKTYSGGIGKTAAYTGNDNIVYMMNSNSLTSISQTDNSYAGKFYSVYVDINGINKAPNSYGKDIFEFMIDDNGPVIPVGSRFEGAYKGFASSSQYISWESYCANKEQPTSYPLTCTGAIIDNGGRILYNY